MSVVDGLLRAYARLMATSTAWATAPKASTREDDIFASEIMREAAEAIADVLEFLNIDLPEPPAE